MSGHLELAPGKVAHPSGALWLPDPGSLLVTGVHFGFGWAVRRRKGARPVLDGGAHKRLETVMEELKPRVILFLDGVFEPAPAPKERAVVEGILRAMARRVELVAIGGSQVRGARCEVAALPLRWVEEWRQGDVVAASDDLRMMKPLERGQVLVLGHVHPVAEVHDDAGNIRRLPAFLRSRRTIVLPAFSPLAGGLDVSHGIPGELREVLGRGPVQVAVTAGKRVVPLKLPGGG